MAEGTVRAQVYQRDPLLTFVEPLDPDDALSSFYELPTGLVHAAVEAEAAFHRAVEAVEQHIADNKLEKQEGPGWA